MLIVYEPSNPELGDLSSNTMRHGTDCISGLRKLHTLDRGS